MYTPRNHATGINLFIVGFTSSSVQLLLIREMMNISGGYELIAGIFLGTWLIASAAGSSVAGRSQMNKLRKINLIFAFSPVLSLLLLFITARLLLQTGETPSFLTSLIYTLIVLTPFCLVSGFTFVRLLSIARQTMDFVPGKSYSIETTGGIASGIMISALISEDLGTYKLLLVIVLLTIAYALLSFHITGARMRLITRVLFALTISITVITEPDIIFRQILLRGLKITESTDTPYGNISRSDYQGEKSLYYNQRLISYSDDVIEREEDIHYAMLQHESPRKVILISGNLSSHLPEIMKYPVQKVVYIERDPALAKTAMNNTMANEVLISNSDAFSYIRQPGGKADVIIMLVPPPTGIILRNSFSVSGRGLMMAGFLCARPVPPKHTSTMNHSVLIHRYLTV